MNVVVKTIIDSPEKSGLFGLDVALVSLELRNLWQSGA